MKKTNVGGQAVIEGVMMRGSKGLATAVRKENGEIVVKTEDGIPFTQKHKFFGIPFIRGIFALFDSLKVGINSLNYSASLFEDTEPSKFEDWLRDKFKEKANDVIIGMTMALAAVLSIGLFVGIPTAVASLFKRIGLSPIGLNLVEALIRILILIFYIWAISLMDDVYRLFQYHGAEHKTIFCYEAGEALTPDNVKKYSRFHPRCGTNFLFLVMLVSVIIISFTGWGNFLERLVIRILLIPVVAGITYEIIKWLGRSESILAKIVAYPGLQLQRLTTREPEREHLEVAIESLLAAEGIEPPQMTIDELLIIGTKKLIAVGIDTARLDSQLLLGHVLKKDKLYLMVHNDEKVSDKDKKEYLKLMYQREQKKPIKYILGEGDFMGLDFYVEEGVLIPRSDTEVLVENVLKKIGEEDSIDICDLCCGTGAIGIALAHYRKNINVDCIDFYEVPEKVTKKNIKKNNLNDRVHFIKSDLLEEVIKEEKKYNVLVSNPPYIEKKEIDNLMDDVKKYEPETALDGGEDGLDFYRRIVEDAGKVLCEDGILAFEIGYNQGKEVKELMENNNFKDIYVIQDLAGLDRVVIGHR